VKLIVLIGLYVLVLVLVAACGNAGAGDPVETVQRYLQAKVERDVDGIRSLLCSEMEQYLERESNTFATVSGASIEDMRCTAEEEGQVVRCNGRIVAVEKGAIQHLLKPKTRMHYHEFFRCSGCDKIYWEGSHFKKMMEHFKGKS